MAKLIYSTIASLDGYVADETGTFGWAAPDEEVHAFVNDVERPIGTYLYGRRMYETMVYWETVPATEHPPVVQDYAQLWRATDKVVYSSTLETASSERTRIERAFDPDAVRALKASADRDLSIGGPTLAAHAIADDGRDDDHVVLVHQAGGGTRSLPDGVRALLELVDEHRFASGFVHLHYRAG